MTNKFYKTSDLNLATTLSLYVPIESIDRSNPRKVGFLFQDSQELQRLVEAYHQKRLNIEPQTYFQQLRIIKTRLYNEV